MDEADSETADSEDNVNIPKKIRRREHAADTAKDRVNRKRGDGNASGHDADNHRQNAVYAGQNGGEKMLWSEDENESTKPVKRRRTVGQKKPTAAPRKIKPKSKEAFVGRRPRSNVNESKPKTKVKEWGDESSDDQLMEYTLPDYLQKRRANFDTRVEKMKEMGLKLPPSYDEVDFSDDEHLADLAEKPEFERNRPVASYEDKTLPKSLGLIPAPIAQWLRDYQVDGTAFLHALFVYQMGGILGDDMGLGKTVQVIAFLTAAFGKTGDERDMKRMRKMRRANVPWYPRVLIVCPGTLIANWKEELDRWGWWHVDVYHGSTDAREAALQAAARGRLEILITTYATYRLNRGSVNLIEWDCVIADECHQIKGKSSETTIAMNEINALCRIGLTGTAIQNSYDELWTLLNWTNPGKFGPISTWRSSVSEPLRAGQSHDATNYQLSKARKTAKALVQNLLPQFFLRRMKTLIANQLPKKSDRVVFCPLTETQAEAYELLVESESIRFIRESTEMCSCGSGKRTGWCCQQFLANGSRWQSHVFPSIYHLQRLANHLATLIPQSTDPREKQQRDLDILQTAMPDQWRQLYQMRDSILNFSNPEFCGKWKVLKKLLRFWHMNGDKVLVFSHSVRLLKMLQMLFTHTTYNVSYLDGAMSYQDRANVVADFNSDPDQFVFLISTKAGGVGLNITSANKVVVVDPNWNPAYDLQAQDRAYRIGQVRDVEVFRLVSAGTIEEIVYARQIYKQQQANIGYTASTERRYFKGVQENKDQKGEIFGLANLFTYQHENLLLRDIVNKTNVAESKAGVTVAGIKLEDKPPADGQEDDDHLDADNPFRQYASQSSSTDTDPSEERAMSQIAALIVDPTEDQDTKPTSRHRVPQKKQPPRSDPILAILSSAGVEYSHENAQIVGPSAVEADLSRRAVEAGTDTVIGDRTVFHSSSSSFPRFHPPPDLDLDTTLIPADQKADAKPTTPIKVEKKPQPSTKDRNVTHSATKPIPNDSTGHLTPEVTLTYKYHPGLPIRKRHLCSMAAHFGFLNSNKTPPPGQNMIDEGEGGDVDIVSFACAVESWTAAQRRRALETFYTARRKSILADAKAQGQVKVEVDGGGELEGNALLRDHNAAGDDNADADADGREVKGEAAEEAWEL